ncbi:MAG: hypothetical protein FWG64_04355, partial [Firmicutes bacterium]|nr:hypothetical protein [Bacillota bacterium]
GISKIVFALQGIQRDLRWGNRNLSNEVLQLKNFLKDVARVSEEAENNAYRILAGASPEEIKRATDIIKDLLAKVPPEILKGILQGGKNILDFANWLKNATLDELFGDLLGGTWYERLASAFGWSQDISSFLGIVASAHNPGSKWAELFDSFSDLGSKPVGAGNIKIPWLSFAISGVTNAIDFGMGIDTFGQATADFLADALAAGAGAVAGGLAGAWAGAVAGSVVPGIGNVVGFVGGFVVSFGVSFFFNQTPWGQNIKENVGNWFDNRVKDASNLIDKGKEKVNDFFNNAKDFVGNIFRPQGNVSPNWAF